MIIRHIILQKVTSEKKLPLFAASEISLWINWRIAGHTILSNFSNSPCNKS